MKYETLQFFENACKDVEENKPEQIEAYIAKNDVALIAEYALRVWGRKMWLFQCDMTAIEENHETILCRFSFNHEKTDDK
jgi:hypothetical protein